MVNIVTYVIYNLSYNIVTYVIKVMLEAELGFVIRFDRLPEHATCSKQVAISQVCTN